MPLIVEDGTGLADANAYIDLGFATEYHADRGNSAWAGAADDATREAAIIKATDYLARYSGRWIGVRATATQILDWPRAEAFVQGGRFLLAEDAVPVEVQKATAELALRALVAPLVPDMARGGRIKSRSVGPISVTYADDAPAGTVYPVVDALLSPLLQSSWSVPLVRS